MLEVVKVTNPQAKLLRLAETSCVFLLSSYAMDDLGRVVEYTKIYNSDERIVFYVAAD
jgi:DNA-binding GntR family transcriptional regulator